MKLEHGKLLYMRFLSIFGEKFTRNIPNEEVSRIWINDWYEALKDVPNEHIKIALDECRSTFGWPPSIAEFKALCDKAAGVPESRAAMHLAIRRDFTHPAIKAAFDKVGSWAFGHDSEEELFKKFKAAYQKALSEPVVEIPLLPKEEVRVLPKETEKNVTVLNPSKPSWPREKYQRWHKDFNQSIYDQRFRYLTSLSEIEAKNLCVEDLFDRNRYLCEIEGARIANNNKTVATPLPHDNKTIQGRYNGVKMASEYWSAVGD